MSRGEYTEAKESSCKAPEKVEDIVARIHKLEADIAASLDKLFVDEK